MCEDTETKQLYLIASRGTTEPYIDTRTCALIVLHDATPFIRGPYRRLRTCFERLRSNPTIIQPGKNQYPLFCDFIYAAFMGCLHELSVSMAFSVYYDNTAMLFLGLVTVQLCCRIHLTR